MNVNRFDANPNVIISQLIKHPLLSFLPVSLNTFSSQLHNIKSNEKPMARMFIAMKIKTKKSSSMWECHLLIT